LRLGLSPGPEGRESWRGTLDGSLDLLDGRPDQAGVALAGARRLGLGKGGLSTGAKAGLRAPAAWWESLAGGAPVADGACTLSARLSAAADLAKTSKWRLELSADGGLEGATAASDWSRWPCLLSCRVGLSVGW
jgi:hypothetical protein